MPALAGPRFALTLAALPALALGFSLRPGPSVPHLPSLQHRHELLNMIAPAPRPKPIDRLLNPLRRQVYTLLKPVSAHAARTVHAHACLLGAALRPTGPLSSSDRLGRLWRRPASLRAWGPYGWPWRLVA